MNKFLVIYYVPAEAKKHMENKTPEEMQEGMKPWMEWAESCGERLLNMGSPLENGVRVSPDSSAPSDSGVGGYSVLQAEDMEAALALVENHPHLGWMEGCSLEVYEMMPLPGME